MQNKTKRSKTIKIHKFSLQNKAEKFYLRAPFVDSPCVIPIKVVSYCSLIMGEKKSRQFPVRLKTSRDKIHNRKCRPKQKRTKKS